MNSALIQNGARGVFRLFLPVLVSVTFLQRFAVPSPGSELGLGFVVSLAAASAGLFSGRFGVSASRLAFYAAAVAAILFTLLFKSEPFSFLSVFMLLTLYMPFTITAALSRRHWLTVLAMFQKAMLLCGYCGLAQFFGQLVVGQRLVFPFDLLLPASFLIPNFNLQIPVSTGLSLLKSNGLWFLEPSHFAQFLAFALIIEMLYFRRPHFIAVFTSSYLISFSGSGIFLLAAAALFAILQRGRVLPFALLAGAAVLVFALRDTAPFSIFLDRLGEFRSTQSSGSMRFVAPYWFVHDVIAARPGTLLFGYGPGQMKVLGLPLDYMIEDTGWLKLLAEYGLVGTVPFMVFYCYSLFRRSPDPLLSFACLFQFMFLGGYLNSFYIQFLHMALVIWPRVQPAAAAQSRLAHFRSERHWPLPA